MTASDVSPENTSEAQAKGKTRFDWPTVFGLLAVAYALAIGVLAVWLWG